VVCSLGVAMFASLLLLTYILHARFFFVDVVFYSALQDVLVAAVFSGVLLYIMPLFRAIEKTEQILLHHLAARWLCLCDFRPNRA